MRKSFQEIHTERGYHIMYRTNEVNHCPGCGRTHWYIGRILAECGFCATALPIENSSSGSTRFTTGKHADFGGESLIAA